MHIVIIGNGVAGVTAARHIRKMSRHRVTLVSSESPYFFSRTALMYVYMGHMRLEDTKPYADDFWKKNDIELLQAEVESIDFSAKQLKFTDRGGLIYDKLVLATGSRPRRLGLPNEDAKGVQGLYSLQDLELMEQHTLKGVKEALVVGGGLIGVEMAEMLHSRGIKTSMLIREKSFYGNALPTEESLMVNEAIKRHGITIINESQVAEIQSDKEGCVAAIVDDKGRVFPCQFLGVTIGVEPNIGYLKAAELDCNVGILVNERFETSQPGVYAIGDCAELRAPSPGRKAIEPLWYTARMMGETLAHVLCGRDVSYQPGTWFNSAKFFDLEYQVYGRVPARQEESTAQLFWQNVSNTKSIRIVYERATQLVLGFNLMGIRYRQEVCTRWIEQRATLQEVLENLCLANFDPEFSRQFEAKLVARYNVQQGAGLRLKAGRKLDEVIRYLRR